VREPLKESKGRNARSFRIFVPSVPSSSDLEIGPRRIYIYIYIFKIYIYTHIYIIHRVRRAWNARISSRSYSN
jgi:hypothetical protein